MASITSELEPPQDDNPFFTKMQGLLTKKTYATGGDYIVPQNSPVPIAGTVVAGSTVDIVVNGISQSPVPDIVADANGKWSGVVKLGPGQNTIQVSFFAPTLTQTLDTAFTPTFAVDITLQHPTTFSSFPMGNTLQMVRLGGTNLYVGNYIPPPNVTQTLAKFDLTTGIATVLDLTLTTPTSGRVYYMDLDAIWLYVAQVMGDSSLKLSRYALDLSARADITTYATLPSALYADGTNLWVVRQTFAPNDLKLTKVTPSPFAISGSEISLGTGPIDLPHNQMADDGTHLVIPAFYDQLSSGDLSGSTSPGVPDLGGSTVAKVFLFYAKVTKSTTTLGSPIGTYAQRLTPGEGTFTGPNSLAYTGGFYYTVVEANHGKILKMQDTGAGPWVISDVIPLPFSTVGASQRLPAIMRLGPDGRLYIVSNGHLARWMPGATSMLTVARGIQSIDVTLSEVTIVDDGNPEQALAAPSTIFTDRANTFNFPSPTVPTIIGCHFNITYTAGGVAWVPQSDGSAFIVERSFGGGGFVEAGREYFGNAFFDTATGVVNSGDMVAYRIRAFNVTGVSLPSSTATFTVPFLDPPFDAATGLMVTAHDAFSISLAWTTNETDMFRAQNGVYRSDDGGFSYHNLADIPLTTSVYTDTGLTPGTSYKYKVIAESRGGINRKPSADSNIVTQLTNPIVPYTQPDELLPTSLMTDTSPASSVALTLTDTSTQTSGTFGGSIFPTAFSGPDLVWAGQYRVDFSSHNVTGPVANLDVISIAFDGIYIWIVNNMSGPTQILKIDATTLATLATSSTGSFNCVFWDGAKLWATDSNGHVYANVSSFGVSVTMTDLGFGGIANHSTLDVQYSMVKVGGFVYALANAGLSTRGTTGPVTLLKVDPAGPSIVGHIDYNILFCSGLFTDGTSLFLLNENNSRLLMWKVDTAGNFITAQDSGGSWVYRLLFAYDDSSALITTGKVKLPLNDTQLYTLPTTNTQFLVGVGASYAVFEGSPGEVVAHFERYTRSSFDANLALHPVAMPTPAAPTGLMPAFGALGGNQPIGIAYDGANMWVTIQSTHTVAKITSAGIVTFFSGATGTQPFGIAYDGLTSATNLASGTPGGNMWVANYGSNSVTKVTSAGVATQYPYTAGGTNPTAIAYDGAGHVWIANQTSNSVTKVDTTTGAMATYPLTGANSPIGIAFDGTYMWTANQGNNSVTRIGPVTSGSPTATTFTGTGAGPYAIAFDGTYMWVTNSGATSVTRIDSSGGMTTYGGIGTAAQGIAYDNAGHMWVTDSAAASVSKVDTATGLVTTYNGTGGGPFGIAFDGSTMWIANSSGNSVTKVVLPNTVNATPVGDTVQLSWIDNTVATALYKIERQAGVGPFVLLASGISPLSPTYTDATPPAGGVLLTYRVSAYNAGQSAPATVSLTSPVTDLIIPINDASATGNHIAYTSVGTDTWALWTTDDTHILNSPEGIAFDGLNMWLVNTSNNSVSKVSPSGSITTYTGTGSGPVSIAFDGTNMWTANSGDNSVSKITSAGVITTFTGTNVNPRGIAYDSVHGEMWVACAGGVTRINVTTNVLTNFGGFPGTPQAIAFDGTNMWVPMDSINYVAKVTHAGTFTSYPGPGVAPNAAIAFDGAGFMWIPNSNNTITKVNITNGALTSASGVGNMNGSVAIAHNTATGDMWLANSGDGSATKVTSAFVFTTYPGTGISPAGIAYDGTNMWMTNVGDNTIAQVTLAGAFTYFPSATGTAKAIIVHSGLSTSTLSLPTVTANAGGQILRALYDGTNVYTVTGGPVLVVSKYTTGGALVASFRYSGTTVDAAVGDGFLWFVIGGSTNLLKLTTSDMATNIVVAPVVGGLTQIKTVTFDPVADLLFVVGGGLPTSYFTHQFVSIDPHLDTVIASSGDARKDIFNAAVGFDTTLSARVLYVSSLTAAPTDSDTVKSYSESTMVATGQAQTQATVGLAFDSVANNLYGAVAGSPGTLSKYDSHLSTVNTKSKNVAAGYDDSIAFNGGHVFATITDITTTSGLSILTTTI